MPHDTIPSAPALPVFKRPPAPAESLPSRNAPALPTELRAIVEDFKRLHTRLVERIVPPLDDNPAHWTTSVGDSSDPFVILEVARANRLLAEGRTVDFAAGRLAFGLLARQYGLEKARAALRAS